MRKTILLGIIAICSLSCVKSGSVIPNVAVNFAASTTDPRLSALNNPEALF